MTRSETIAAFLGLKRNTVIMLGALVFAGLGERLWLGFAPKYLETLGASVIIIGAFDALQTWLGAAYSYPGGWLTDRWGQGKSLVLFALVSLAGYALVLAWRHWIALLAGAFLFLAWSALSLPATFAVVSSSLQQSKHSMGIGLQSLVRRVPMMLGPLAGGWLITRFGWRTGMQLALISCIGLSAATAGFQFWIQEPPRPDKAAFVSTAGFVDICRSFTPALRELLVSDILIRFCERIPYAFVVLWAMDRGGITAQQYGFLVAIEMTAAMLCYVPVAHLADTYGRGPFVFITFIFFTMFPLALIPARSFPVLAFAFVIRGLKEFGEPARKAMIIAEAEHTGGRARTYGAYYLIRDSVVAPGAFLGAALWEVHPWLNFIVAATLGAAGTWWFAFNVDWRPKN